MHSGSTDRFSEAPHLYLGPSTFSEAAVCQRSP